MNSNEPGSEQRDPPSRVANREVQWAELVGVQTTSFWCRHLVSHEALLRILRGSWTGTTASRGHGETGTDATVAVKQSLDSVGRGFEAFCGGECLGSHRVAAGVP